MVIREARNEATCLIEVSCCSQADTNSLYRLPDAHDRGRKVQVLQSGTTLLYRSLLPQEEDRRPNLMLVARNDCLNIFINCAFTIHTDCSSVKIRLLPFISASMESPLFAGSQLLFLVSSIIFTHESRGALAGPNDLADSA